LLALLFAALIPAGCAGVHTRTPPTSGVGDAAAGSSGVNLPSQQGKPYLVLVSLDGFRADYLDRFELPNLRRLMTGGTRARAMVPVFPSLTFPNHYSLVTGLYPEHHGIVANSFYDPGRGASYALGNQASVTDGSWYRGQPIWVAAETQGMVSACYFWPGSEAAISGVRPTYWKVYSGTTPNEDRVAGVIDWLRLPEQRRPHVITVYFNELDSASHRAPLDSPSIEAAARSLDRAIGLLMDGIDAQPIRDQVYLLVTSDHGMVETGVAQTIRLASLVDVASLRTGFGGPVANLYVTGGLDAARQLRDTINARLTHGRAYLREEVPERHHYRANPRIGDVVVIMEESWTIAAPSAGAERAGERWGMHGWDPALPSMRAVFVIAGPGVRAGATIEEVRNIDVYPLMAHLLGLGTAQRIDGHASRLRELVLQ
jgi:alkaline phosphatase D